MVPSVFQDLTVYRRGAEAIARDMSPYGTRTHGHGDLVFTYPPFAGVAFIPLTWMSWAAAAAALTAVSALCYVGVVLLTGRQLCWSERAIVSALVLGLAAAPLLRTVQQGQINLILAALVAVDLWLLPRRWRGCLIGIAARIKIVPAVFALHLVARRDWRGIAMVGAGGLATVAAAWLIAPDASLTYWTQMALDTSRSGGGGYPDNQSLIGVLARVLRDDTPPVWITLPLQTGALAAAYLVARKATTARQPALGVVAIAVGGLLASPVSWSHHWIWAAPMVMALVSISKPTQAILTAIVFTLPPMGM
jgi:alpha-1,2-mannosyltransferase